jgi:hypothetical protein
VSGKEFLREVAVASSRHYNGLRLEKLRTIKNLSVGTADDLAEIRTEHLRNAILEC